MSKSMPDPIANVINRMLDHIHVMEERQAKICGVVSKVAMSQLSEEERASLKFTACRTPYPSLLTSSEPLQRCPRLWWTRKPWPKCSAPPRQRTKRSD